MMTLLRPGRSISKRLCLGLLWFLYLASAQHTFTVYVCIVGVVFVEPVAQLSSFILVFQETAARVYKRVGIRGRTPIDVLERAATAVEEGTKMWKTMSVPGI